MISRPARLIERRTLKMYHKPPVSDTPGERHQGCAVLEHLVVPSPHHVEQAAQGVGSPIGNEAKYSSR
jgi:hypothetical protein